VVVDAQAEDVGKPRERAVLCLIARTLANQVAGPISRGGVPRRTAATPSVTSIDFCQALRPSDLAGAPTVNHRGFANGCGLSTKAITLGVQAGFRPDGEKPAATVTVIGCSATTLPRCPTRSAASRPRAAASVLTRLGLR
jgi:hypothetical protein